MRRIAVINQKGGVGKTTTTASLGVALAIAQQRVLLIDLDPQAHLTLNLGVDPGSVEAGAYEVLIKSTAVTDALIEARPGLWLLPAHTDLVAAETELISVVGREVVLRDALTRIADRFDYLLIDCPPSLNILTLNALSAVDEVFIPLQPHFLALQGLAKLLETIALVQTRINARLRLSGIIMCLFEAGTRLAGEIVDDIHGFLDGSRGQDVVWSRACVFDTIIRRNIKLAEAPGHGQTIFEYAPRSRGAADYAALAREVLSMTDAAKQELDPKSTPIEPRAQATGAETVETVKQTDDADSAVPTQVTPTSPPVRAAPAEAPATEDVNPVEPNSVPSVA
ncbi:MAG: ParA family protein [Phycisphaerae bacterium]